MTDARRATYHAPPTGVVRSRSAMRQVVAAALLAFALTHVGASPAFAWLDAGELAAAGHELGVMHPPGMPGLAALLQLATLLPLGPVGWRMALVSSACAAVVAALTLRVLLRRGVHPAIGWGALAWLFVGMTLLRHARGVELYLPQLAALTIVADGFDPARPAAERLGPRLLATFAATWAIWCFAELRMLLPPLLLVVWVSALRGKKPYAAWAPVVVACASACVFAIPLAAAREPLTDWADPSSLSKMIDHLLARSIRVAYADDMLPRSGALWLANAGAAIGRLGEDLGPSGPILGLVALVSSWVGRAKLADRRSLATMSAWTAGSLFYAVGVNPMGGVDRQTGLVLAWCVIVLVAVMLDRWLDARPRLRFAVLPIIGTVLVVPAALRSVPDFPTMRSWAPQLWTRDALAQLPTGSMLLTQSDDLSAGVIWAQVVEGARPDVLAWPGQHLHRPPPPGRRAAHANVWDAVLRAGSEASRIEAAIAAHDGPVALENAAAGVFATVRFGGGFAALPLAITTKDGLAPVQPEIRAQIDRWLPRLPTAEDRRRLAVAIAEHTRGHVRRGGDLGTAVSALQSTLADVDPDHVGSMITLGGIFDRMGESRSAIDWTRRALALDPERQVALLNLALYLAREPGLHPDGAEAGIAEATALAERATALRPWRPETWQRLAEVRAAAGDDAAAAAARAEASARAQ
jgi:tetratricopeptide (TPR) repeat protein